MKSSKRSADSKLRASLTGLGLLLAVIACGCLPTPSGPTASVKKSPNPPSESPFQLEADFTGLSLSDFERFPTDAETWSFDNGLLVCSGKPRGYLYSRANFGDFTWRFEYRFPRPEDLEDEAKFKGNTGFMIYITGDHKVWPVSLEVQGKHVQMGTVKANGGAEQPAVVDDEAARKKTRLPVGEWNRVEIVSRGGKLVVKLNDELVCTSEPAFLSAGQIGIQAEDHSFEVRRMRIRRDDPPENSQ